MNETRLLIGQILGFIPLALAFFIYLFNDRRKILIFKMSSDFLWAFHYILIGAYTGAVMNLINSVRDVVFYNKGKKYIRGLWIPIAFVIMNIISCTLTGNSTGGSWIRFLPMIGSSIAIIGLWCSEPQKIRYFMFPGMTLWLIYCIMTHSISSTISNCITLVSLVIAEVNYRKSLKKTN